MQEDLQDKQVGNINVKNSYNIGNVNANVYQSAGIVSYEYAPSIICENCYNLGKISQLGSSWVVDATAKGIGGKTITNCYNFGKVIAERNNEPSVIGLSSREMTSCYYNSELSGVTQDLEGITDVKDKEMQEVVDLLNNYKDESGSYPTEWKKWTLGENGYPTLVED